MVKPVIACLLIALAGSAQNKPAEKTVEQLEADKRDPKLRGEALLENASALTASVKPETQVATLMHLGANYQTIDRKKAIDYLRQAFTASSALADHPSVGARGHAQASIIGEMSNLDTGEAISMLRQMEAPAKGYDRRSEAAASIIAALAKRKDFDGAIGVVDTLAGSGVFPYNAAQGLFKELPAEDPRRLGLFASATSAYSAKQNNQFADLLVACWDGLPEQMAQTALDTLVKQILNLKDDDHYTTTTISSAKGGVHFDNVAEAELFKVMALVQRVSPEKAKEILDGHLALRSAMDQFPGGQQSMGQTGVSMGSGGGKPSSEAQMKAKLRALSESRGAAAMAALAESPQKALSLVNDIPLPEVKASTLGAIARSVSDKDPVTATAALTKCIALLDDLKDPSNTTEIWADVASAAHQSGDDKIARMALERSLADAGALFKKDTDEDGPNNALREQWPSTNAYRRTMISAAKVLGVDAEPMLDQIKDPDMRVLAQIELAQALLGRPHNRWSTSVSRSTKK